MDKKDVSPLLATTPLVEVTVGSAVLFSYTSLMPQMFPKIQRDTIKAFENIQGINKLAYEDRKDMHLHPVLLIQ
jgi:hypothetical protein